MPRAAAIPMSVQRLLPCLSLLVAARALAGDPAPSGGATVLDQSISLQRSSALDSASRIIDVSRACVLLVIVDENGTDVSLKTRSPSGAVKFAVNVENGQQGESLEIAVLEFQGPARVHMDLDGPQERLVPGTVRLRVVSYLPADRQTQPQQLRLTALREWMRATRRDLTAELASREAIPGLDAAIARLEAGPAADPLLAARVRLLRARTLYNLELGWRDAWLEARRATAGFLAASVNDRLNAARSRWLEAAALQEISLDRLAKDPTAAQAEKESRLIFTELTSATSALDSVGLGRSFNMLALADRYALDWPNARRRFQSAISQYRAAGHRAGEMQSIQNLALLESDRGDYASALLAYEELLANIDSVSDADTRATFLINAAGAESNAGKTDEAIAHYLRALAITREHHFDPPQGRVLQGLGRAYWARGDYSQAETYFNEALALRSKLQDGLGTFGSLLAAGTLLRASGNAAAALLRHQEALARAPNKLYELQALVQIAEDQAAIGTVEAAIVTSRKALAIELENADHPARADAKLSLARQLMARNVVTAADRAEATTLARGSVRAAGSSADVPAEIESRRVLARVLAADGNRTAARDELQRSINLIFAYRNFSASPELRASTLASQQQVFQDLIDLELPQDGAAGAWTSHRVTDAQRATLRVLESVRALNFDMQRLPAASGQQAPLDQALSELAARQIRVATLRARESPPQRDIELLQLEMANLRARIDQLRARSGASKAAALTTAWSIPESGEMQLSYMVGSRRAFALLRTAHGMQLWTLPETPAALNAAAFALARIDRTQRPREYDAALVDLSPKVLPPAVAAAGARALRIAADGALALVPFAGLSTAGEKPQRLIENHTIRMSASLLRDASPSLATARQYRFASVSGPGSKSGETFASLPGAEREVRAIADIFVRSAASDSRPARLLDASNVSADSIRITLEAGVDVMHFATHGFTDSRHPLAAMLTLPGASNGTQRYLTSAEVQEWRGNAGLIFLSACETAVGTARFGESLPGLQRAFLRAGANKVIATLWPVEDRLAEDFAVQFYRRLAVGEDAAIALAATQRAWAVSGSGVTAQKAQRMRTAAWAYVLYSR